MNIFISHSWKYSGDYERIKQFLTDNKVDFRDYSVPYDDPIQTYGTQTQKNQQLWDQLETKIKLCSCVIIPAGKYASYSNSIQKEIDIACNYQKPIIAVRKFGASQESATAVAAATICVNWSGKSIADAVKEACK